jgi:exonuclease SbcC
MNNVFVKDAIETKASIKKDQEEAKQLVDTMKLAKDNIDSLKASQELKEKYDELNTHLQRLQSNKLKTESENSQDHAKLVRLESNLKEVEIKIQQHNEKEAIILNNDSIEEEISAINKILEVSKEILAELNNQIVESNSTIQFYQKQKQKTEESIEKLQQLEDQYKYYEYYLSAVCRDGIPYNLISSAIPKIEDDINNILNQVVDFQVMIQSDGKNINAFIVYDDDRFWPIELSSGMEKFISSIAIRTSLINASSLPRPNFLAIDEGFGALDHSNMSNISVLMDYLKTQFKFIVMISHIDSIKDVVDNHIEVVKNKEGSSKVNYE